MYYVISQADGLTTKRPASATNTDRAANKGMVVPMSTTNATTARTIIAKSGMILPATIDQQTDFNLITTAMSIYYKRSGCLGSFATAVAVADAMRDSSAVVVLYVGLDGGQDARVLWPNSITFTKDNKIVAKCYCTLRKQWKTGLLQSLEGVSE